MNRSVTWRLLPATYRISFPKFVRFARSHAPLRDSPTSESVSGAAGVLTPGLPQWLAWVIFGALLLWFSGPTVLSVYPFWEDYNYSHGYLVPFVVGFLVIQECRRAPLGTIAASWTGLLCFLVVALVVLAARASTTMLVEHAALPLLWIAGVWAFAGAETTRRFALPLAYLYVAMPMWHVLNGILLYLTVAVASAAVQMAGIPAFIDGNFIHLPSGTIEVEEGCAGLCFATAGTALGAFAGLVHHRRWQTALLFASIGLALAVIGNWARVFMLVVVGYVSEMQNYLITQDHVVFGWVVFALFMLPLFYLSRRLEPKALAVTSARHAPSVQGSWATAAFCCLLAIGIWANHRIGGSDPGLRPAVSASATVPGWVKGDVWQGPTRPLFLGVSSQDAAWYVQGASRVGVYIADYALQGPGQEVVFSGNRPEGEAGTVVTQAMIPAPVSGTMLTFRELTVSDATGERRLVWVMLRVAGEPAAGEWHAKVLQLKGALRGRRDAQALVLTAVCEPDCDGARKSLSHYASSAASSLFESGATPSSDAVAAEQGRH